MEAAYFLSFPADAFASTGQAVRLHSCPTGISCGDPEKGIPFGHPEKGIPFGHPEKGIPFGHPEKGIPFGHIRPFDRAQDRPCGGLGPGHHPGQPLRLHTAGRSQARGMPLEGPAHPLTWAIQSIGHEDQNWYRLFRFGDRHAWMS